MKANLNFTVRASIWTLVVLPIYASGASADTTLRPKFSFLLEGHASSSFLSSWPHRESVRRTPDGALHFADQWRDPNTGLQVRCEGVQYPRHDALEWTVYLKNTGQRDTPIISDLLAMDSNLTRTGTSEFKLHHNVGSPASASDYGPLETPLGPGADKHISAAGGRGTNSDLSYFNLSEGNQGTIIVVGWPGQWAADFKRDASKSIHIRAGQEQTHFRLHPGEEFRSPLMVLQRWTGDWLDGQNKWRRWMMAYGMPKPGGNLPKPMMLASSSRAYEEMIGANEANQIMHIDRYMEEKLPLAYWWMDAGWYIQQHGWPQVGTWEADPKRFPKGFKPISDHAHARGVKTLVWFEPERVAPGTYLADHHQDWLLNPFVNLESHSSSQLGTNEPCVTFNTDSKPFSSNRIHWKAKGLSFHPGPKGEYSDIRFTASADGTYQVAVKFEGIDERTTTDVHVLGPRGAVFSDKIDMANNASATGYQGGIVLKQGQTIDFVVGFGNGSYVCDSTGIDAAIISPDGIRHRASEEYKKRPWAYGYLPPGTFPDAKGFQTYDRTIRGGANGNQLLNLGNPDAWHWLVDHIDRFLTTNGIDLYRQDFNMDPLDFWRSHDDPDRQGITENKHIVGYLAYWDELRKRHPNMLIDSCASGGRRNDLETMRRAVPLWRSDYAYEPNGHQGMTYGISMWIPYHGTGTVATTDAPYYGGGWSPVQPYAFWSNTAPSLGCGVDVRVKSIDYDALRRLFGEWQKVSEYYYGDFYPLTPYSIDSRQWIGWQFNRPEHKDGVVELFRRSDSSEERYHVKLRGLDPKGTYYLKWIDGGDQKSHVLKRWKGSELMSEGVSVQIVERPGAAILQYVPVQ